MRKQGTQNPDFRKDVGVFLVRGEPKDRGQVAAQHDRQLGLVGHKHHLIDRRAKDFGRLGLSVLVLQALIERRNSLAIDLRHVRMQERRRLFRIRKLILQLRDHSKVEDKVVRICPRDGTVTLKLTLGYTFGKPIFYLSTEANDPVVAALEGATYAPALKDVPFALEDASPGEAAERIYVFINGPMGVDNPFRQGLDSALSDKGTHGPLNVLGGIPTINLDL